MIEKRSVALTMRAVYPGSDHTKGVHNMIYSYYIGNVHNCADFLNNNQD